MKKNKLRNLLPIFIMVFSLGNGLMAKQYETTIEVGGKGQPNTWDKKVEWSPEDDVAQDTSTLLSKANDYKAAFDALKKADPGAKIFMIVGGMSIDRVQELTIMPSGSLILVEYLQSRKIKTKVIKVEDISEMGQR
ncbi:MAG: hypothetical protein ACI9S8_001399 [Chlamydiales bacterium]|jgi:hypothetical protein